MNKIRQAEAIVLLSEAEGIHTSALMSFNQATSEANKKRTNIRTELDKLERDLQSCSHAAMPTKLADAEVLAHKEETQGAVNAAKVLQRQLNSQMQTTALITAITYGITAIMAEMKQRKKESETIRKELEKTVEEVEELTTDLESKIHKLRNLHNIKSEVKFNIASQHLGTKRDTLKQQSSDTQDQLSRVFEQIKNAMENIDKLLSGAEDLIKYGIVIENAKRSTRASVTKLQ
ncbi:hypothetical protein XELAEV_18033693mg [Xenopus laevis]|uniref:Uncharacterized protein n=1 Tax=Xenopus laevis TaxID=8355 RepID=A0A974CLC3_XENLA|nr:hypothetical protein XELAEV_18033693mg [Xenopus laevis]